MIKDVIIHNNRGEGQGVMTKNLVVLGKQNDWALPALFAPDEKTAERILEFFTAQIRNPNTRKAYDRAIGEFAAWCKGLAATGATLESC